MLEQAATFATLHLPADQVDGIVQEVLRRKRYMLNPLRDFPYLRDGYRKGRAEGKAEGKVEGKAEGKAEGLAKGLAKGKAQSLLALLDGRGIPMTPALRKKVLACAKPELLDRWFRAALTAKSVADVLAAN